MGHAYIKNLNDIFLKKIYAKGKVSLRECIDYCIKNKIPLHASEGNYFEEYMLQLGFAEVVLFHAHSWNENRHRPNVEPIIENDAQLKVISEFNRNGLSDIYESDNDGKIFESIQWKFTKQTRKMYIDKTIPIVENMEN